MKKIEEYRRLLSVAKDASLQELKSTYRGLMKDCHPDKFQENSDEQSIAEAKSKRIIEAYHFLVSIAPQTIAVTLELYTATINEAGIDDFEYKNQILRIDFSNGSSYEYFNVPKAVYVKLVNAPTLTRFARRHICTTYVYRSVSKLVAA